MDPTGQGLHQRNSEIKNNLTVTRGEVGGDNGGKGGRVFRNNYKGHIDKTKEVWNGGDGWGWGKWWGEKADNLSNNLKNI